MRRARERALGVGDEVDGAVHAALDGIVAIEQGSQERESQAVQPRMRFPARAFAERAGRAERRAARAPAEFAQLGDSRARRDRQRRGRGERPRAHALRGEVECVDRAAPVALREAARGGGLPLLGRRVEAELGRVAAARAARDERQAVGVAALPCQPVGVDVDRDRARARRADVGVADEVRHAQVLERDRVREHVRREARLGAAAGHRAPGGHDARAARREQAEPRRAHRPREVPRPAERAARADGRVLDRERERVELPARAGERQRRVAR